jgi:hypothetical protein
MEELLDQGLLAGVVVDVIKRGSVNRSTRFPEIAIDYERLVVDFALRNDIPLLTEGVNSRMFEAWSESVGASGGILVSHGEIVSCSRIESYHGWWVNLHTFPWQIPWPSDVYDGCTPMEQMYLRRRRSAQVVAHIIDEHIDRGFEIARSPKFDLAPLPEIPVTQKKLEKVRGFGTAMRMNQLNGAKQSKLLVRSLVPRLNSPIMLGQYADFETLKSALGVGVKLPQNR